MDQCSSIRPDVYVGSNVNVFVVSELRVMVIPNILGCMCMSNVMLLIYKLSRTVIFCRIDECTSHFVSVE